MRYTQPQSGPLQIDWSNPITRGLIAAAVPHLRYEAVTGKSFTQVGAYLAAASTPGIGLVTNGSNNNIYIPLPTVTLAAWTIFALVKSNSAAPDTRAVNFGLSTNDDRYIQVGVENTGSAKVRVLAQGNGGTLPANQTSVGVGFDGLLHMIVMTYDGTNVRCYIDGVLDTTAANSTGAVWTINQLSVGALQRTGGAAYFAGSTFLAGGHNRALSATEVKSLYLNPWQVIKSPQRVMLAAAVAATYSYTASGGFTLSGTASTVRSAVKTASGGIALSGAAIQSRGAVRSAAGGIQLSGTASIAKGRAITASGGLSISGAASILRGVARSTAGGLQLAGASSVTFFSAVQSRVVTPVGGIIISGTAAVVRTCTRLVSGGIKFGGTSPVEFFSILSTGASDWIGYIRRRGRR